MGRPCVCGASELADRPRGADGARRTARVLAAGDLIAIDGTPATVTTDDVPLVEPEIERALRDGARLGGRAAPARACARTPTRPRTRAGRASFGAEGIGLCRTEHMFMQAERLPKMRAMIMADDRGGARARRSTSCCRSSSADFEGIFEAMEGLPVTIRLLDPPLHEFLPTRRSCWSRSSALRSARRRRRRIAELEAQLERVRELEETNPMLGTRGCRLGILYPEIYEMQVRAIVGAALAVRERTGARPAGRDHDPAGRLRARARADARARRSAAAERRSARPGASRSRYTVGTMIELPRACLVADQIADHADFFSFGTNDLTQTALGFSRDDVERRLPARLPRAADPRPQPVRDDRRARASASWCGSRPSAAARPTRDLKLGICGEHGGDPDSIALLRRGRARLRELLAVPRADRPRGGRAGRDSPAD